MAGYSPTGPFTSGSAPGLSAAYNNAIEAFIQQFEGDTGATTITGGTSGTAVHYQILQGTVKICVIWQSNFKTGGSDQNWTLPAPFTTGAHIWCGGAVTFQLLHSGSQVFMNVLTALANTGGTTLSQTTMSGDSQGNVTNPFDTFSHTSGAGSAHTGITVIIGI